MNESVLKSILDEIASREWAEYANVGEHVFSTGHNRSMQRIFKLYGKNTRKLRLYTFQKSKTSTIFTRKKLLIAIVAVFLALLTGCAVAYFISNGFRGEVYEDNTELFVIDTSNCPSIIEEEYFLSALPENFDIIDEFSTPFIEYVCYENVITGKTISFTQYVKSEFDSRHYNTEYNNFIEVEINDCYGLCLDLSNDEYVFSGVIWDNGDYILELTGKIAKNELIDLAESAEICKK